MAQDLKSSLSAEYPTAIATYKGATKRFLQLIAAQLDIPTQTDDEKPKDLTVDALKDEMLDNVRDAVMVFPEAHRLPSSVRYWLLDCISEGARVVCLAPNNPKKDLYLELLELEMELPSDERIRQVMRLEAKKYNLRLTEAQLAELQPLAGRNPMLARKVIRAEALGLKQKKPEHTQYLDIWPLVLAFFALLGMMKFIGQGTKDRSLYVVGGVAMMAGLSLRYAGQVKGATKKLT